MKLILSYLVVFGAGLVAGGWWIGNMKAPVRPTSAPNAISSVDGAPFGDLGLRSGDILKSVNGDTSPQMMNEIAKAGSSGDVCVVFERAGKDREICLKQRRTASAQ